MSTVHDIKIFAHTSNNVSSTTCDPGIGQRIGLLGDTFLECARTAIRTVGHVLGTWWTRRQQRLALAAMVRDGYDFSDIGITAASARREASKFPWQQSDLRRDGD